jgi:hypothetical protein
MLAWNLLFLLGNASKKFTSYKVSPSRKIMANAPVRMIEAIAEDLKEEVKKPKACPFWQERMIQSNFKSFLFRCGQRDTSINLPKGSRLVQIRFLKNRPSQRCVIDWDRPRNQHHQQRRARYESVL